MAEAAVLRRCTLCRAVYGADERFCPKDGGAIVLDGDRDDPLIGKTIGGRYFVRRPIGRGGMGVVYEADHIGLDKRVAVKLILEKYASDREALTRFHREARNASRIGHPNIVDVTDIGDTDDGRNFIAMEYLEGADLSEVLRQEGQLAPERAVAIVRQVLEGLHAAHAVGILHRDMKPENVFLTARHGQQDFVKIMDFGISKFVATRDANLRLTDTGTVVGTPIYMAPEQAMGSPDVDHRVDIYAVGVMLYELVSGRPPFNAQSYLGLVSQHVNDLPPPLRGLVPNLPVTLAAAVHKALEKDPNQRFADAADFARALPGPGELAGAGSASPALRRGPISGVAQTVRSDDALAVAGVRIPAPSQRTTAWRDGPRRWPWLAVGVALVAAGAGVAWWTSQGVAPAEPAASAATAPTLAAAPAERGVTAEAPGDPAQSGATAATVTPIGVLEVSSEPAEARVFIDGVERGRTPLRLDDVVVGEHELRLEVRGHDAITATKVVRPGYVESFHAVLAARGSGRRGKVERGGRDRGGAARPEPTEREVPSSEDDRKPAVKVDPVKKPGDDRKPNPYISD